jgi:hypothetical protein
VPHVSKAGFATTWSRGHFERVCHCCRHISRWSASSAWSKDALPQGPPHQTMKWKEAMKGQMCSSDYFSVLPVWLPARIQSCIEGLVAELPRFSLGVTNVVVCSILLTILKTNDDSLRLWKSLLGPLHTSLLIQLCRV